MSVQDDFKQNGVQIRVFLLGNFKFIGQGPEGSLKPRPVVPASGKFEIRRSLLGTFSHSRPNSRTGEGR